MYHLSCAPQLRGDPVPLLFPGLSTPRLGGGLHPAVPGAVHTQFGGAVPSDVPPDQAMHTSSGGPCRAMPVSPCSLMDFPSLGGAVSRETFTPAGPNTCGPGNAAGGLLPAPTLALHTRSPWGLPGHCQHRAAQRGPSRSASTPKPGGGCPTEPQGQLLVWGPGAGGDTGTRHCRPTADLTAIPSEPHRTLSATPLQPHCSFPTDLPRPRCSSRVGPSAVPSPARGRGAAPSTFTPLG